MMPTRPPPSPEDLVALLEAYQQAAVSGGQIPDELEGLLDNVRRSQIKSQGSLGETEYRDITPEPGFVVKTVDGTGRKVFLNMCGSSEVPAPGGWQAGCVPLEVKEALENLKDLPEQAEAQETLRFPLSCGSPREDVDKQGEPCSTIDCVLNADVIQQATTYRPLKVFLIQLGMNWVKHKHQLELDPKFKLPKMKYKGRRVEPQRIRKDKKALVTEMDALEQKPKPSFPLKVDTKDPRPPADSSLTNHVRPDTCPLSTDGPSTSTSRISTSQSVHPPLLTAPDYDISYLGRPVQQMEVTVKLSPPHTVDLSACTVQVVGRRTLQVTLAGWQQLEVPLPFHVDPEGSLVTRGGPHHIKVTLQYLPLGHVLQEMKLAAPHKLGSLALKSSAVSLQLEA